MFPRTPSLVVFEPTYTHTRIDSFYHRTSPLWNIILHVQLVREEYSSIRGRSAATVTSKRTSTSVMTRCAHPIGMHPSRLCRAQTFSRVFSKSKRPTSARKSHRRAELEHKGEANRSSNNWSSREFEIVNFDEGVKLLKNVNVRSIGSLQFKS